MASVPLVAGRLRGVLTTLHARFVLDEGELSAIKEALERAALRGEPSVDREYRIDLTDGSGVVHATVEKTVYVRRKEAADKRAREVA